MVLCAPSTASVASAQLRPLEPIPWRVFDSGQTFGAEIGASRLAGQRASLAGTEGTLTEVGNFALAWRMGRVALELAGTGRRLFREESRFTSPYPSVSLVPGDRRRDSGDYRLTTAVRVTSPSAPVVAVVRFGVRLPTTDNTTGLDRDATDLFLTIGGSGARGPFHVAAEAGLGIHGTREPSFEQEDLLLYAMRAEWRRGAWTPSVMAIGQMHGLAHPAIRGTEHLGETRAGVRFGTRRWIRIEGVRGFSSFSPSGGILLTVGIAGFARDPDGTTISSSRSLP